MTDELRDDLEDEDDLVDEEDKEDKEDDIEVDAPPEDDKLIGELDFEGEVAEELENLFEEAEEEEEEPAAADDDEER
jgi:hypothetical protein